MPQVIEWTNAGRRRHNLAGTQTKTSHGAPN